MSALKPRTRTILIHVGDYLDRIEHLRLKADAALEAQDDSLPYRAGDEDSEYDRLRTERDALIAEAEAEAVTIKVGALGRKKWHDLMVAHPPRDGNDGDQAIGVNEETFKDELVAVSLVEPSLTSRAAIDEFMDDLCDIDFDRVYYAAFALNRAVGADPKSLPASPRTHPNAEI